MQRRRGSTQGTSRRRGEASPCADVRGGLGGAYDIGRDGTSSGGRAQAHSCGRDQAGGTLSGVLICRICGIMPRIMTHGGADGLIM
nr:MAG TPA: hypothetical protein [Caudoviricetes sp.]